MNFAVLIVLTIFGVQLAKTQGTKKTTCILIPAYNREDFAEGENEEEEIEGWGPGPAGQGQAAHGGSNAAGSPIVTHSDGEGNGVLVENTGGSGEASAASGGGIMNMRDRSKPPGPKPKGGYWEWDDESGRWEFEDYRRKRKRRQVLANNLLRGQLQCRTGTVMHINSVTLGFSIDNKCRPPRATCQATSRIGRQVAHCEGKTGNCDVAVQQQFLNRCGRRTNFARIKYECIPETEIRNICDDTTFESSGSVVIASPSFNGSGGVGAQSQFLSCECQVSRAGGSQGMSVPYVRTVLDAGGGDATCGEDMLLLDTWDANINRFTLKEELCGVSAQHDMALDASEVKLTYIPSSTRNTNGFLMKLEGTGDAKASLQVSCTTVPTEGGPSAGSQGQPPPPPAPQPAQPDSNAQPADKLPKLPPNFDIRKYPGLLNRTLAAWRQRMNNQQQQQGSAANQIALDYGLEPVDLLGNNENVVTKDGFDVTGTSGTLSAVVASLASIIVIMGSLGVYMWYRRSQRKKNQNSGFYRGRSTVRSTASIYSGAPIYHDPDGPSSNIPTTIAPSIVSETNRNVQKLPLAAESMQGRSMQTTSSGDPPALPKRPPRPKREKCRPLPSEETVVEEVEYDNAGCDVKVMGDNDYASLNDISNAMNVKDTKVEDADVSEEEV